MTKSAALLRCRHRTWLALAGLGLTLAFLAGCRDGGPSTRVYVRNGTGQRIRVAIIPFSPPPSAPAASEAVTSTVITYLLSTGAVDVVEPGAVDRAMRTARFVPTAAGGMDPEVTAALQQDLNVDAYLVGQVEEYGDVRIGPDTYPAVSFSARLIRASDNTIVWAASISRTGADRVKVFDIGRVSSIGKLTKSAVEEMANSLRQHAGEFSIVPGTAAPGPALIASPAASRPKSSLVQVSRTFTDEARTFGEADLKALLPEVPGFTREPVSLSKHYHDTVTARYRAETAPIDVKLVDYRKADAATKFVELDSKGMGQETVASLAAFSSSGPDHGGFICLNLVAGRFGLFLNAPQSASQQMRDLAAAILSAQAPGQQAHAL